MADENEVKALIARFWEVRQKLSANTSETTFWAMVALEALRWRDETRPVQRDAEPPAPPAAVPAGYVPVPVEPTEAMLNAARDWSLKKYGQAVGNDGARGCYAAMLAAANKEPSTTPRFIDNDTRLQWPKGTPSAWGWAEEMLAAADKENGND